MDAASGEKPDAVRTHLRNMIIVPEMIGSVVGVYNGKTFNQVGHLAGRWGVGRQEAGVEGAASRGVYNSKTFNQEGTSLAWDQGLLCNLPLFTTQT